MKEKLYTIPVTEAFQSDCDCPICAIHDKLDKDGVNYIMGPSYMEGDIRMETNKVGFCREHFNKMYHMKNRLGLALMIDTHLQEIVKQLEANKDALKESGKKSFFSKGSKDKPEILSFLNNISDNCYVCNKINASFDRYIDTIFHLWSKEPSFRELVKNAKGFCFEHFTLLLDKGKEKLSKEDYDALVDVIVPKQTAIMSELEKDVNWFVEKNKYEHKDDPWGNAKDSVERALRLLAKLDTEE